MLATADELRDYLEIPFGELDDDRAELALTLVEGPIRSYCRRSTHGFEKVTGAEVTVNGSGTTELLLPTYPILGVTEVLDRLEDTALTDDVDFEWRESGVLTRLGGYQWSGRARAYVVTFDHGFEEVPVAVKSVALRLAARLVTNPEGLATESAVGYASGFAFDASRLPTPSEADRRDLNPFRIGS